MNQLYYVLALLVAAVVTVFLAAYTWRRRPAPGAWPLVVLLLAAGLWSAAYAAELTSEDLAANLFWAKVQYIGIVTIAPAWFIFAVRYTARRTWFTRSPRNLALLAIIPVITLILVWTNEAHGLVWSQTGLDTSTPIPMLQLEYGPWFWVYWLYAYLLLLLGSIWFASMLLQSARLYRWQVGVALLGMLAPWIANLLYVAGLTPANLDLTPFAFILAGLAYALSLFRFHLLDIVPVAHRAVVDGLSDCVIVCDLQSRIVDVNPVAERLAGLPASRLIGRPAEHLLGRHAGLVERCRDLQPAETEISMTIANVEYYFEVRITPLLGEPHQLVGRLVVLHDVTDRKRAEEELRQARDRLELIVAERTAALEEANRQLRDELAGRQEAERRYRILFEEAPVMYVITRSRDGAAIVADCNRLFLDTLGYRRDEVLERPLADFYTPESRAELADTYPGTLDGGPFLDERQLLTREGQVVETLLQAAPEVDRDGNAFGTRAMFTDLTQRKQAERRFQELLESAPDAMVIVNEEGRIILVNAQTERVFGFPRDELLDEHIQILLPLRFHGSHLEHMVGYYLEPRVRPMGIGLEVMAQRRDGSEVPVEISLSPLKTAEGLQVSAAIRDISERKQAEEALQESEAKFRNIFESSPLGMHMYQLKPDRRLVLMEANPAADEILGVDHDNLVGRTLEEAFPDVSMTELPERFRRVAASGESWSTDQLLYEGSEIFGAFEVHVFQTSPGRIVAAFADITERKQAEEAQARLINEIKQQREELRALARRLAVAQEAERKELARELHDQVGQSLTALDFSLNMIRSQLPDHSPASDQIRSQVDASLALLAQTADRIRDVMADLRPPVLDDYGLVAALEWYGTQVVKPRGIAITVDGREPTPRLAPPVELALFRIAQEALTNVIKHAQATMVTVQLEADPDQDTVRLIVADDGGGFEPADRAGPADRQSWGLIGMLERAEAVGAHCRVESDTGLGTQVIVEVPR
ncbi:MAG TPA: histidine kinase N-terminal 7TM domain-containing protein [Anaerolineae bacterium]|nr:histidine kinase N-terminal 7TM domain-containing protein [Anaerolineae bacterium]